MAQIQWRGGFREWLFCLRIRRAPLLQLSFEIRVRRCFEPRGQPDVAEHLPGLHKLAFEKWPRLQTFSPSPESWPFFSIS
jgi:hypothetical protein